MEVLRWHSSHSTVPMQVYRCRKYNCYTTYSRVGNTLIFYSRVGNTVIPYPHVGNTVVI